VKRRAVAKAAEVPAFSCTGDRYRYLSPTNTTTGCDVTIHYIDIKHYVRMLEALDENVEDVSYPIA
jgi:hypothetical protein